MAERPMKMPAKKNSDDEAPEVVSQRAKPGEGTIFAPSGQADEGLLSRHGSCPIGWPRNQNGLSHPSRGSYDSVNGSHTLVQLPAKKDFSRE